MRWEYATLVYEPERNSLFDPGGDVDQSGLDVELNGWGAEGWELVSAVDTNDRSGGTRLILFVFKRPLPG